LISEILEEVCEFFRSLCLKERLLKGLKLNYRLDVDFC
jgi:hypothetical protein